MNARVLYYQVMFAVIMGIFALGNAAPNFASLSSARGAAVAVFTIIDLVSVLGMGEVFLFCFIVL